MAKVDRLCASSSCSNVGKHLCSGCGEEIYCSKECQKSHWATHKQSCKTAVKPEAAAFLKSFDSLSAKQLKNIMKAKAATYEGKRKSSVLAKLENIVEKPGLVKLVSEHVDPSEVEGLLSGSFVGVNESRNSSSSSTIKDKRKTSNSNNNGPTPTPEQLRQQASMMRKQPHLVRKANAAFANMTDEQIRQYADQLDQAASDPQMMKEVERMSRMSDKERSSLQKIQEGLSGTLPMDDKWIEGTIQTLKTNSGIFKSMLKGKGGMLGGVTDEQMESFVDYASSMETSTLKLIIRAMIFLGSCYKPMVDGYSIVDKYTLGSARYLVLILVSIFAYYASMCTWFVLRWIAVQLYALYLIVMPLLNGSSTTTATGDSAAATVTAGLGALKQAVTGDSLSALSGGIAAATAAASTAAAGFISGGTAATTDTSNKNAAEADFDF